MKKTTAFILFFTVFALGAFYWLAGDRQLGISDSASGSTSSVEGSGDAVDAGGKGKKTGNKGTAATGINNTIDKATALELQRKGNKKASDLQPYHAGENADRLSAVKSTGIAEIADSTPIPAKELQTKAEAITGVKVDILDYAKAGEIIIRKLSPGEIKFLFGSAKDDLFAKTSVEELEKIRSIIFSKLSSEDISILRAIGKKYGKSMHILDPDLDVARFKAER